MNIGDIVAHLKLEMGEFSTGLNKAQDALQDTASNVNANTASMSSNIKALVMQNLGQIGEQVGQMGRSILSSYGEMIETTTAYVAEVEQQQFVYKNLSKEVQKSINDNSNLANSLGMTKQQYMNNATSIASYLENAGVMPSVIAEQSAKITTLTADMAAFANVPVDTAVSDFKSALMGNYQVLDKYGVNMNVATINNSEYAKQLGKTWEKMNEAEKKQAILNEMYRQTGDYTGLASQEAESFAMQMNLLKQRITETVATLGEKLLPVLEPIIQKISEVAQKLGEWIEKHPKLTQFLLVLGGAIGALMAVIGPLITLFASLSAIALTLGVSIGAVCAPIALVVAAIVGLIAIGWLLYDNWDTIGQHFNTIWEGIKGVFSGSLDFIKGLINGDYELMKQGATEWGQSMQNIFLGAWELIKAVFNGSCEFIKGIFTDWYNTLDSDTQAWIDGILNALSTMWESLKSLFQGALDVIKGIWNGDWNQVSEGGKQIWDGICNWFKGVWELLKSTVGNYCSELKTEISNKFNEMKDNIKNKIEEAKTNAINKFNELKTQAINKVNELKTQAVNNFNELKTNIVNKINEAKTEAINKFNELKTQAVNKVKDAVNGIKNAFSGLASDLRQKARDAVQGIINGLADKLGEVKAKAKEIADNVKSALANALKIKSPSRVMRDEIGRFIPEGVAVGIDANADTAIKSAENLANSLVVGPDMDALRSTVNSTGYSNNMYSSNSGNQMQNTLNAILHALTNNGSGVGGLNINIEEFNNNTEEDVNSLMQRIEAQIRLNNLGKGVI